MVPHTQGGGSHLTDRARSHWPCEPEPVGHLSGEMALIKYATFTVLASAVADANGGLPDSNYAASMTECCAAECVRESKARGMCSGHYNQWRRGEAIRPLRTRATVVPKVCTFVGCDRVFFAKNLCQPHYAQLRRGSVLASLSVVTVGCAFSGCPKSHESHGFCNGHNIQRRLGRDLIPLRRRAEPGERQCSVVGCDQPHVSKDLCVKHYNKAYWDSDSGKASRRMAYVLRRARKAGAETYLVTKRDWTRLVARYGGLCAYCQVCSWQHREHVIPLSRGGRESIGNLLPVCASCNTKKRARLLMEWRVSVR